MTVRVMLSEENTFMEYASTFRLHLPHSTIKLHAHPWSQIVLANSDFSTHHRKHDIFLHTTVNMQDKHHQTMSPYAYHKAHVSPLNFDFHKARIYALLRRVHKSRPDQFSFDITTIYRAGQASSNHLTTKHTYLHYSTEHTNLA